MNTAVPNERQPIMPIRLVFELARAEHPRLYDDLIQFRKGTKRVNRLRILAYDGLLAQASALAGIGQSTRRQVPNSDGRGGDSDVMSYVFSASLNE